MRPMPWRWAALGCVLLAGWDAWHWYALRLWYGPDEAGAALVLLAALALAFRRPGGEAGVSGSHAPVMPAVVGVGLYAVTYTWLPPLLRAAVAVTTLGWVLHVTRTGRTPHPALVGLLLLALPVVPSLQFYLGYPARVAAATLSVGLLRLQGLAVSRQGTQLLWRDLALQFDAPCSGVRMLWSALFLALLLAAWYRLRPAALGMLLAGTTLAVLAGNALRGASLFHVETAPLVTPLAAPLAAAPWLHEGVGVLVFAGVAGAVALLTGRVRRWFA